MDLTPQLVVQVQDEVHVSFADGPLPSRPGLPPLLIPVPVLVQDGLESCGVCEDHGDDGLGQTQEQAHCSKPARKLKRLLHVEENTAAQSRVIFDACKIEKVHVEGE